MYKARNQNFNGIFILQCLKSLQRYFHLNYLNIRNKETEAIATVVKSIQHLGKILTFTAAVLIQEC